MQEARDLENLEPAHGQKESEENLSSSTVWLMVVDELAETCTASIAEEGVPIYSMSRGDLGRIHPKNNQTPIQLLGGLAKNDVDRFTVEFADGLMIWSHGFERPLLGH